MRLVAVCAFVLLCALGCASAPPDAPADLAGTYLFDSSQRIGDKPVRGIPLVPLAELLDRTRVEVAALPNGKVSVTFTDTANVQSQRVFEPGRESVRWSDGCLVYEGKPWYRGVPIFPGIATETLRVSMFREPEGSLVVQWSYRESGMAGFLLPFVDSYKGTAILSPCAPVPTSVAVSNLEHQW